jgi:hypothetical protein
MSARWPACQQTSEVIGLGIDTHPGWCYNNHRTEQKLRYVYHCRRVTQG